MTPEQVFKHCRAYKIYYGPGKYDIRKYGSHIKTTPFIEQRDRQFYYRLSTKLNDAQIHALFTSGFFFNPKAHISDFVTPDAQQAAIRFASRGENGATLLQHDLYELAKRLKETDTIEWLYGESSIMPPCVGEIISGELPLDLACLLLLIPQQEYHYHWTAHFDQQDDLGLGPKPWIDRLKKADILLSMHRQLWRLTTHKLAKEFWGTLGVMDLAPKPVTEQAPALF